MKIFIAIMSHKDNSILRESCRLTWLKKIECNYRFFVGGIVQEPYVVNLNCPDGRENIVKKQFEILKYSLSFDYDYLFQCDDDCYVLYDRIIHNIPENCSMGEKPGAGMFLSRNFVNQIVNSDCQETDNDIFIAKKVKEFGYELEFNEWFSYNPQGKFIVPTLLNYYITCHHCKPDVMKVIHEHFYIKHLLFKNEYEVNGLKVYEFQGNWFGEKDGRKFGPLGSAGQLEKYVEKIEEFINHEIE